MLHTVLYEQASVDSKSKALLNSFRTVVLQVFRTHQKSNIIYNFVVKA